MNYNTAELCKDCKMPVEKQMLGNNLVREVAHLTNINYHTEARLLIANAIRDRKLVNAYKKIQREHKRIGHLPRELGLERSLLDRQLERKLRQYDDGDKVLRAL